jgi:hypothetical protein
MEKHQIWLNHARKRVEETTPTIVPGEPFGAPFTSEGRETIEM